MKRLKPPSFVPKLIFTMACGSAVIPAVNCGNTVNTTGVAQGGFAGVAMGGFSGVAIGGFSGVAMGGFSGSVAIGGFSGVAMGGFGGTSDGGSSTGGGGAAAGGGGAGTGGKFTVAQMGFTNAAPRKRAKRRRSP